MTKDVVGDKNALEIGEKTISINSMIYQTISSPLVGTFKMYSLSNFQVYNTVLGFCLFIWCFLFVLMFSCLAVLCGKWDLSSPVRG